MIRLNDLNNFLEISSFTSFSLASKKLGVTQPALSESIGRLEKDLQLKLFYRTKNGISLTPEGRKTLDQARRIQSLLVGLKSHEEVFPTLILGCHSTIGAYFLPKFFTSMANQAPGYQIQLKHDLSRNVQSAIQSGQIDLGVVVNPVLHPDLVIREIARDQVCVWKSKKHTPQNQIIADPNLFQVQNILKKWNKSAKPILASDSLDLIARLTEQGCGYGILPERIVKLLDLDLVQVAGTPVVKDQFCVVHRPEFGKSVYEKRALDCIVKAFQ